MQITFNNLTSSNNIICLSGVPNILTFTGSSTANVCAEYVFAYTTIINIEVNTQYNIVYKYSYHKQVSSYYSLKF